MVDVVAFYYVVGTGVAVAAVGAIVAIGFGIHALVSSSTTVGAVAVAPIATAAASAGECIQPTRVAAATFALVVEDESGEFGNAASGDEEMIWHVDDSTVHVEPFEENPVEELPWWATRRAPPPPTFQSIAHIREDQAFEKDFSSF